MPLNNFINLILTLTYIAWNTIIFNLQHKPYVLHICWNFIYSSFFRWFTIINNIFTKKNNWISRKIIQLTYMKDAKQFYFLPNFLYFNIVFFHHFECWRDETEYTHHIHSLINNNWCNKQIFITNISFHFI